MSKPTPSALHEIKRNHGIDGSAYDKFDSLQGEIIAMSVLAAAGREASNKDLLGHDWSELAKSIMPMIAERANAMTFVGDILVELEQEPDEDRVSFAQIKRQGR